MLSKIIGMTGRERAAFWSGFKRGWIKAHLILLPFWLWAIWSIFR